MTKIIELLDEYTIDSIEKEFISNPFFGYIYELGYSFGANVQIKNFEVRQIESLRKYSGDLSGFFTLYLKTQFRAKGNIKSQSKFIESFDENFVMEGKYDLVNKKGGYVEGTPSVKTNFSFSDQSEIKIDSELQDFDILMFPS